VDDRALVAHLLRRTSFGPFPGQVEALAEHGIDAAVRSVLSAPAMQLDPPEFGTDDDERVLVDWWLDAMADPTAGLHEKMVWFWHGHLTSSLDKAEVQLMWRQHQLLRKHAMGNFRDLLQAITIDAAMLAWLDGNGSKSEAPNQNYGREVMELFTLGHEGGYTEADVAAAATAFSGWWIDDESNNTVRFDPQSGPQGPVTLLGSQAATAADAIDIICDHPSCAPYIAAKLHRTFTGVSPSPERTNELAAVFSSSGLEIRPLIEAILGHPSFLELRLNRPRVPVEWYLAANAVLGAKRDMWILNLLGQMPFIPPNVAGWPSGDRWLSAGAAFTRAQVAWDHAWDTEVTDDADPVAAILAKASLFEVSDATRTALNAAARTIEERRDRASILHALVVCSPEFALS
jgi:uncharacterized protein (DUF1800 family)